MALNAIDYSVLAILQQDGRITNAELAQRVGLTPGPMLARVSKLEASGYIQGYTAILNRDALGLSVTAFVSVIMKSHDRPSSEAFVAAVMDLPEVLECHHIAGEEDYLLKVIAASPADYERFLMESLSPIDTIQRIKTTLVLSSPKNKTTIPIRGAE